MQLARRPRRAPRIALTSLVDVVFNFDAAPGRFPFTGLDSHLVPVPVTGAKYDLDFNVIETAEPNVVLADLDSDGRTGTADDAQGFGLFTGQGGMAAILGLEDADVLAAYIGPFVEPATVDRFTFSREWLRSQTQRLGTPGSEGFSTSMRINLPPEYLLIHRVTMGTIGVLCQLGGEADFRSEMQRWQPGFAVTGPSSS